MAKVICSLPNASELINGVKFVTHRLGMISEEVEDAVAAAFSAIPGYAVAGKKGSAVDSVAPVSDEAPKVPAEADQKPAA